MSTIETRPQLRLVGEGWNTPAERRHREVADENHRAARNTTLDPTDPRWVLATRVSSQLQGAALTWDRRRHLLEVADRLGVRQFDANMIIAIVQDHARRGRDLSDAAGTIALLDRTASRGTGFEWLRWTAAIMTALVGTAMLIWWVTS